MAHAIAKYVRMSPRKVRRVVNIIRGKDTHEARTILKFMPYAAARVVEKVLNSAVSNATHNENLNEDELRISKAFVDQTTTLRRWRAMSRGRGYPILKKTSNVTIEVSPDTTLLEKKRRFKPSKIEKPKHVHKHEHKHEHEEEHKHEKVKAAGSLPEPKTKEPAKKKEKAKKVTAAGSHPEPKAKELTKKKEKAKKEEKRKDKE